MGNIYSMTGFGRYSTEAEGKKITVEMKSVNHRYLDLNIKMPKRFNPFESDIRNIVKERINRGKVDMYITFEDMTSESSHINYNSAIAARYMEVFKQMAEEFSLDADVSLKMLASCPDVITTSSADEPDDALKAMLLDTVNGAITAFAEARRIEGASLTEDLLGKLDFMSESVDFIVERSPKVIEEYKAKLSAKIAETVADRNIDDARVLTEAAIFADKVCVDEEMVRLKSHITSMKSELKKGGAVGRKLDFIAQEMNREANTTLSKSNDIELSERAVVLKTEVEKVREQIQNIE